MYADNIPLFLSFRSLGLCLCLRRTDLHVGFLRLCLRRTCKFLIEIDFLNAPSGHSYFPLANQNAHLTTHEPNKIRILKVKILWQLPARAVYRKAISVLNPRKSWRKIQKAGRKREEIFKICDSIRTELQDEEFI